MKITIKGAFVILAIQLTGCDGSEKPITESQIGSVRIVVKLPGEIEVLPVGVMYRSVLCPKLTFNGKGEKTKVPGFHYITSFFRKSDNGTYSLPINMDGGGQCQWKLSNATIEIKYKIGSFNNGIERSIGSGIIIVFDDNLPQRYDGQISEIPPSSIIKKDYYPWINEKFLNGHFKQIWLYSNNLFSTYKYSGSKDIIFEPISHTDLVTYSVGPKVKVEGGDNYTVFKYSDGTVNLKGKDFPDFEKLQSLSKNNN
ncbi:hypothetical protein M975_1053 [Buttiauxella brennerae ATCC 51605]|uniref:Uncharacterized protein n=1 Tax=Buttiauxella brennerae ATCC 51605 TaxID=1354251 RepID=A0A1B7IS06_9ENTR|nr:hypothetical protein [Buttiauxella brennerae]OAT32617.1 hypothetical protein M975_1053 [Buttiauxella brennerae ATCC 51605]